MKKGIGPTTFHFLYSERLNFLCMLLDKKLPEESKMSKKKFRQLKKKNQKLEKGIQSISRGLKMKRWVKKLQKISNSNNMFSEYMKD